MKINYYENEEVVKNEKSIFLAGPTPRTREFLGWRPQAIEILKNLGFDGAVYSPENVEGPSVNNIGEVKNSIVKIKKINQKIIKNK